MMVVMNTTAADGIGLASPNLNPVTLTLYILKLKLALSGLLLVQLE